MKLSWHEGEIKASYARQAELDQGKEAERRVTLPAPTGPQSGLSSANGIALDLKFQVTTNYQPFSATLSSNSVGRRCAGELQIDHVEAITAASRNTDGGAGNSHNRT